MFQPRTAEKGQQMKTRKLLSLVLCVAMLSSMTAGLSLSVNAAVNNVQVVTSLEFSGFPTDEVKKYCEAQIYWNDSDEPFVSDNGVINGSWQKCANVTSAIYSETATVSGTIHPSSLDGYYIVIVIYGHSERDGYRNLIGYYSGEPKSTARPTADHGALYSGSSTVNIYGSVDQLMDDHGKWAYCILQDEPAHITAVSNDTSCGTVTGTSGDYDIGSSAVFTAVPASGSRFIGWYRGNECVSADPTLDLIATYDSDYTAMFEKKLTYIVNNGEATITGCDPSVTGALTIPSVLGGYPVVAVGSRAFYNNTAITSVVIPDSVTEIGSYAFAGCSNLTGVTVGNSVASIGTFAFNSCTSLTNIIIPNSVTAIGGSAFKKCTALTGATLSNNLTSIEASMFEGCSSLTAITVPYGVQTIGDRVFYGCTKLISVSIPSTLRTFGNMVFYNCALLSSVELPNGMTNLGTYAFYGCKALGQVSLPIGITAIDKYTFYNCSAITSIAVPNGVTTLDSNAFYRCGNLSSVTLPDTLTTISANAFYYCTSLTEITIPASVTSIATSSFKNSGLVTIRCYPGSYAQTFGNANNYNVVLIEEHTHSFGSWTMVREATCTDTGLRTRVCSICGYEESEAIPTVAHSYIDTVVAPGCETDGYTSHVCSVCGHTYSDNTVAALGHSYNSGTTVDPTCTENGYTAYTCTRCGDSYNDNFTPALGHDYEARVTEPTCSTSGYTVHSCSRCGDQYVDSFVNAVDHDYIPEVVDPSCTTGGYTAHVCRFCGTSYTTDPTPALGHNYTASVTAPTCTTGGYTTHVCTRCEDTYTDSITPALGHNYTASVTAPTCTAGGYTAHVCTRCEDTYTDSITPALGHNWGEWTDHPTDAAKEIRYCTRCDATELRDKENVEPSPVEKIGGYKVRLTGLDASKSYTVRYATGEYTTARAVKKGTNAGFAQISGVTQTVIALPTNGVHTISIQTGTTVAYIGTVDITGADIENEFLASTNDLNLRVENLYQANYVKLYRNGKSVATVGSAKFSNNGLRYWVDTMVSEPGTYTVRIVYLDGNTVQNDVTFTVPEGAVSTNGRIFTLSEYGGAGNVSFIRLAKGTITTNAAMKAASDLRIFGAKYFREESASFAALDAVNGETTTYTVQVGYVSGYSEFITFDITPTVPVITAGEGTITLTNVQTGGYYLDWVRCAPGVQSSLYGIRHAKGSQIKKTADIVNDTVAFTDLSSGAYTLYYLYDGWNLSEGMVTVTVG